MGYMFFKACFNGDIGKGCLKGDEYGGYVFYCKFNGNISAWSMSRVTNMNASLVGTYFANISRWNVSKVTNMQSMFYGAEISMQT